MTGNEPRFGPGREFERIRRIVGEGTSDPRVSIGPGDDACVLTGGLILATDLCVEGVHFRPAWISYEEAGFRAAAAGLSDLAAMAAEAVGVLVSVAAPADGAAVEPVMDGVKRLAGELDVLLLGGDLTRSPGPVVVDVVSVGRNPNPLLRSGARPGDELWVTGELGGAAGAVALWEAGRPVPDELRRAFVAPRPRLAEARALMEAGARAGMDLSDGLAGDAAHLSARSGVSVVLRAEDVPVHPGLEAAGLPDGADPLDLALHGGEDFELLVASPPGKLGPRVDEFRERFHLSLSHVGDVASGAGVSLVDAGGRRRTFERGGHDHFRRNEDP